MKVISMAVATLALSAFAIFNTGIAAADGDQKRDGSAYGDYKRPLMEHGVRLNVYNPGGSRLTWIDASTIHVPMADHLSSHRLVVGGESAFNEYGPYGSTVNGAPGSTYAGHPYDAHRLLYETPSRSYDPSLGRFLGHDPAPGRGSPYAYAGLNPITNLDPGGDIDIPFFIGSGFATGENSSHYSYGLVGSIKSTINNVGPRQVVRDDRLFSYHENEPAGLRFHITGQSSVRSSEDANSYRHGDTVYWLVGNDASVDVRRPLDVAEVFSQWRNLRPGIASKVVIVDASWDSDRSQPIRSALDEAGIGYAFISTMVTTSANSESARGYNFASAFRIGDSTVSRAGFASYVQHVLGQLGPQTAVPGWMMPPRQDPPGSRPSLPEARPSPASDPTTGVTPITTDQSPVEPMETWIPSTLSMDDVSLRHGSDPLLSSASLGPLPLTRPAPLDSNSLTPTIIWE